MPRITDIPKWRRLAMQGIMWIILAGTVGVAALVSAQVTRSRNALGPPVTLGGDVQVRLPKGWLGAEDDDSTIEARESADELARSIHVKLGVPSSLLETIRELADADGNEGSRKSQKIPIADQEGTLVVRKISIQPGFYFVEASASAILPPGNRKLTILLRGYNSGRRSEIDSDVELVKRVAASVQVAAKRD